MVGILKGQPPKFLHSGFDEIADGTIVSNRKKGVLISGKEIVGVEFR